MADEQIQTTVVDTPQQAAVALDPPANETPEQKYARLYSPPSQAAPVAMPAELTQTLQSLQQEIASLKQQRTAPVAQAQTPSKLEWVEKIRQGDFDGAQTSIANYVQQSVEQSIRPQLDNVRQQAYHDALNAAQVNVEVDRYLQTVRNANPDIIPMERYLQGPVAERIQLAQQAGYVKTPSDFLREYKKAVDSEVVNLRNLGLQFRAAGKDEALTRTSDVLRSTALSPQQVQSTQNTQTQTQDNQRGESTDDYFTRRAAEGQRRRGME